MPKHYQSNTMYSSCGVCTPVQVKDVQSEYNRNVKYNI